VVNTNPLYTAREMEHQFNDSGAKALVCLANMAHLAETVVPKTGVKHVIVTEVADLLPPLKRLLINSVIKYVKKMVPAYHLPKAVKFNDVLARGMASRWRSQPGQQRRGGAAIHRRHHRRGQGRDADPPQPGGQHAAVQGADGLQPQ
jgi:acyl-CoA synthetase (AMP-forming)/AMP-acid ligase II